jgi:predicted nucleic acid-binding protein
MRPWLVRHEAQTSILVYGEVAEHVAGQPDTIARRQSLQDMMGEITPLDLTIAVMDRYATIRRRLRPPHGPGLIGDIDTLIAETAFEHDFTLVTSDGDFRRVPGLRPMLLDVRSFAQIGGEGTVTT